MRAHGFYPIEVVQPKLILSNADPIAKSITALALFASDTMSYKCGGPPIITVKWRCEYCSQEIIESVWRILSRPRKVAICPSGRKVGLREAIKASLWGALLNPNYNCLSLIEKKIGAHVMVAELLMGKSDPVRLP